VHKIDNVASAFNRLKRSTNIFKSLKLFRKTSATLLKSNSQFSSIAELFLGHAPRSIADRHYAKAPHELLDDAITWLGTQYGVVQPVVAAKSASTEAGKAKPRTKRKGKKQKCKTSSNATKAQGKKRAFSREVSILEQ
jgi:hypothetical protein